MEASYLAVAKFRKPHGLKGEALVYPLTDEPDEVFVAGRVLVPLDDEGHAAGSELVIHHARAYQRSWLLGFEGITDRSAFEGGGWSAVTLGASTDVLRPPTDGEMYLHEVPGSTVVEGDDVIGIVKEVLGVPGSQVLVVVRDGKDHMVPFRKPIVTRLDRAERRIEVKLPPGLLEI